MGNGRERGGKREREREMRKKLCYKKFNTLKINWRWTSHEKRTVDMVFCSDRRWKRCKLCCVCFPRDSDTHRIEFLAYVCSGNEMVNGCNGCDHNLPYKSIIYWFFMFHASSSFFGCSLFLSLDVSFYWLHCSHFEHSHNFEIKKEKSGHKMIISREISI